MQFSGFYSFAIYLALLTLLSPLLGSYLFYVFNRPLGRFESFVYRITRVSTQSMNWKEYLRAFLAFQILGFVFLILVLKFNTQQSLSWDLILNIAVSFVTQTNWQSYAGESTLSHLSQMLGLGVQNFYAAASGVCVLLVLTRGIVRTESNELGNFWIDLFRCITYVFIPISCLMAVFLVSQGAIQNFAAPLEAIGLEGVKQWIPGGPVASQTAIAVLGSNGGGFFGQNIAHPFANPSNLSNFMLVFVILFLPAGLVHYYGLEAKSKAQAWVLYGVMAALFVLFYAGCRWSELNFGSLEGKELRFGDFGNLLLGITATASSNGSANLAYESLSPLASGLMMLQMMLGEVIFGGVGTGLYGMLLFVLLTVFVAGLMIGRTPEYLGKKIEAFDITWSLVAILISGIVALSGAAISCLLPLALGQVSSSGAAGLSELLWAFSSAANNNGSALAGLSANTPYFNLLLGFAMLLGRFGAILAIFAIAGSLARKKSVAPEMRTFDTGTPLFAVLLGSVILLIGALTFLPGWFLGPLLEHATLVGRLS